MVFWAKCFDPIYVGSIMVRSCKSFLLGVRKVSCSIDIPGVRHRHFAVRAQIDQRRQAQTVPNRVRPLHKTLLHVVGLGVQPRYREKNGEGEEESAVLHGFTHFNCTPCVFSIYRTKRKALFGNFPLGRSLRATQAKFCAGRALAGLYMGGQKGGTLHDSKLPHPPVQGRAPSRLMHPTKPLLTFVIANHQNQANFLFEASKHAQIEPHLRCKGPRNETDGSSPQAHFGRCHVGFDALLRTFYSTIPEPQHPSLVLDAQGEWREFL